MWCGCSLIVISRGSCVFILECICAAFLRHIGALMLENSFFKACTTCWSSKDRQSSCFSYGFHCHSVLKRFHVFWWMLMLICFFFVSWMFQRFSIICMHLLAAFGGYPLSRIKSVPQRNSTIYCGEVVSSPASILEPFFPYSLNVSRSWFLEMQCLGRGTCEHRCESKAVATSNWALVALANLQQNLQLYRLSSTCQKQPTWIFW